MRRCPARRRGPPRSSSSPARPGIGKTRLVASSSTSRGPMASGPCVGGCLDLADDGLPYAPLTEALRGVPARPAAGDASRPSSGRHATRSRRLLPGIGGCPARARPRSTMAPIGHRPGRPDARSGLDQARLFGIVLELLGGLAADAPTLLVFEDLHWVDRSTRDLVTFLVRNLDRERLLLVLTRPRPTTGRPGHPVGDLAGDPGARRADDAPRPGPPQPRRRRPPGRDARSARAPDGDLVERIHARSDGNPFFVEELVAVERAAARGPTAADPRGDARRADSPRCRSRPSACSASSPWPVGRSTSGSSRPSPTRPRRRGPRAGPGGGHGRRPRRGSDDRRAPAAACAARRGRRRDRCCRPSGATSTSDSPPS